MGLKSSFVELRDWLGYKKRESVTTAKIIKKQLKKEKEQVAYYNFKKVAFQKIDEILYNGEYSRAILRPHEGKERYFAILCDDEDFKRYYNGRITAGGELEVSMKKIEL